VWHNRDVVNFADFDSRGYPTVDVRSGYGEWVDTYERTVQDAMDVELLEALERVAWPDVRQAVDLGCGTGRTGAWLRSRGVHEIDGVDLTPEMLEVARSKGVYRRLVEGDVTSTGLDAGRYDLAVTCLVDEHLAELAPLYEEAHRLTSADAGLVLVGYHPHFIMTAGMPTHYDGASGRPIAIETHVHLLSDHVTAGLRAGWTLVEMCERTIDDVWLALKPKWTPFKGHPIAVAFVWRKPASAL
jgi:SAM-dependent methyltransferase